MREIKFRAWDKTAKRWVPDNVFGIFIGTEGTTRSGQLLFNQQFGYPQEHEIEIMQFTGLKDKNGKEIYEGDIVKSTCEVFPLMCVTYFEEFGIFALNDQIIDDGSFVKYMYEFRQEGFEIEIVGNIYENPELIK